MKRSPTAAVTRRIAAVVGVALIAVVNLLPILWGAATSLKPEQEILSPQPKLWGFDPTLIHYETVLSGSFGTAFMTSIGYGAVTTILAVFLASFAAYALDRLQFRFRKVVFYVIVACVPLSIGAAILVVPTYIYFTALGLSNQWFTLPLVYLALNLPLAIWVMKGSLEAIPKELDQAGKMDGLSNMGILFRVILPLCRPGIFAAGMLVFIGAWSEFLAGTVLVQSAVLKPVQVAIYTYITSFGRSWGPLNAAAILAVVPILILLFVLGRQMVSGLMRGSVKG